MIRYFLYMTERVSWNCQSDDGQLEATFERSISDSLWNTWAFAKGSWIPFDKLGIFREFQWLSVGLSAKFVKTVNRWLLWVCWNYSDTKYVCARQHFDSASNDRQIRWRRKIKSTISNPRESFFSSGRLASTFGRQGKSLEPRFQTGSL